MPSDTHFLFVEMKRWETDGKYVGVAFWLSSSALRAACSRVMQRLAHPLFHELEVVELAEGFGGSGGVEDEEEGVFALDALEARDVDGPFRLPTRGVGGEGYFAEDNSAALSVGVVEHDGDGAVETFGHEVYAEAGMRCVGGVGEVEILIADDGAAGVVHHGTIGDLLIVGALLGLLAEARGLDV